MELPWLLPQMQLLQRAHRQQRLPHALLIHDSPGAGGEWLAQYAAQLALCRAAAAPCGHCRECQRVVAGSHPDLHQLGLIEESKQLRVEQVRELINELQLTSHDSGAAVAILQPAELTSSAANALLKTLEEPRPGVIIVLVTTMPSNLPATIISRCQRLRVVPPPVADCNAWLERQRGPGDWQAVLEVLGPAPLLALQVDPAELTQRRRETFGALAECVAGAADIPALAGRWSRGDGYELQLACIENWITRQLDSQLAASGPSADLRTGRHLPAGTAPLNIGHLIRLYDSVRELARMAVKPMNRFIALEQLLWQLSRAAGGAVQV